MEPPNLFSSEQTAFLRLVQPFEIHGARFVDLGFTLLSEGDAVLRRVRVSDNLIYPGAKVGDQVRIGFLMGNVTRITLLSSSRDPS